MKKLKHKNILGYFGCIMLLEGIFGIAMEMCEATLDDLIKSPRSLKLSEVSMISKQILEALAYMHELGIIHRYCSVRNIHQYFKDEQRRLF